MAKVTVEVPNEEFRWLVALSAVRVCTVEDLLAQSMRITSEERGQVAARRYAMEHGGT